MLQFLQPISYPCQQRVHIFGGVLRAKADAQGGADGQIAAAHGQQRVARLALITGRAARNIDRAGVQIIDKGLAVDAVGREVDDLPHCIGG